MDTLDYGETVGLTLRVTRLLADYALHVDARDAAAWADLFTEDGALVVGGRRTEGRVELEAFAASSPHGIHLGGVPSIDVGAGGVVARSKFIFVSAADGRILAGNYTDTIVDDGSRARFAERSVDMAVRITVPDPAKPAEG